MTDTTKQIAHPEFHAWAEANGYAMAFDSNGDYLWDPTKRALQGWLAARATPVSPAQTKLPVDPWQSYTAYTRDSNKVVAMEQEIASWRAHYSVTHAAPAKPQSDLHSAIMNLGPNEFHAGSPNEEVRRAYGNGYRRCREEAAELVGAAFATPSPARAEPPKYDYGPDGKGPVTFLNPMAPRDFPPAEPAAASVGAQVAGEPVKGAYLNKQGDVTLCQSGRESEGFGFAGRLYTAPVPAPATVDRDAVLEEARTVVVDLGYVTDPSDDYMDGLNDGVASYRKAIHKLRTTTGSNLAAPAAVPQGVEAQKGQQP